MAIPQERWRAAEPAAPVLVEGRRVSWSGVWSGYLIGLGTLMLLGTLGLAIGVTTADVGTGAGAGAKGLGIGGAIWAFLAMLIAYFISGAVASRMGMTVDRPTGAMQGALVWALGALSTALLAVMGVTFGLAAVFGVASGAARSSAGPSSLSSLASGDVDQIIVRLNDPATVTMVTTVTGMSADEARAELAGIRQRVEAARGDPARAAAEAREGIQRLASRTAQAAQPAAAATGWATFVALLASLAAAVAGGLWGSGRAARRAVEL